MITLFQFSETIIETSHRALLNVHELPHGELLGVVRLGWVAGRGSDALVLDLEHVSCVHGFRGRIAPQLPPNASVQLLSKRLRQAVAQCLEQDLLEIVHVLGEGGVLRLASENADRKGTQIVPDAG